MHMHRPSYEKDLYKKVRIHCVNGRTLPCRQGYEKDIRDTGFIFLHGISHCLRPGEERE